MRQGLTAITLALLGFGAAGCGVFGTGACVYVRYEGSGYEYRCENGLTKSECEDEHNGDNWYAGECCDPSTTKVDNPDECTE